MAFTVSPWNVQAIATPHHLMHRFLWHRHVVGLAGGDLWPLASMMTKISYRGYRFPPVIIQQAIWLYARFTLSFRDVEDLLAERGIFVSHETVRRWVNHFGSAIAADLRKRRPKPHCTWHLDEMYIKIDGRLCRRRRGRSPRRSAAEQAGQAGRTEVDAEIAEEDEFCARQAGDR
jgi:hypothetical protein